MEGRVGLNEGPDVEAVTERGVSRLTPGFWFE